MKGDTMIEKMNELGYERSKRVWCGEMEIGNKPFTCFVKWSEKTYYDRDNLQPIMRSLVAAMVKCVDEQLAAYNIVPLYLYTSTVGDNVSMTIMVMVEAAVPLEETGVELYGTTFVEVEKKCLEAAARFTYDQLEGVSPRVLADQLVDTIKCDLGTMGVTT